MFSDSSKKPEKGNLRTMYDNMRPVTVCADKGDSIEIINLVYWKKTSFLKTKMARGLFRNCILDSKVRYHLYQVCIFYFYGHMNM